MEKFKSYETAKAPTEAVERLPVGGYILKIMNAAEVPFANGGRGLKISFDIVEGEHKNFYRENLNLQKEEDKKWKGNFMAYIPKEDGSEKDGWTANAFKGTITAIEDSNTGYHWDWNEVALKGKLVGGVFGNKEYEINGKKGMYTDCRFFTSIEKIKSNTFKLPKDKLLNGSTKPTTTPDFEELDDDSDLPF